MKTIEEGAKEFVDAPCDWLCANCATDKMSCRFYNDKESFTAGAEWMHSELTRWHDPKEELPEYYKAVEVKYKLSGLIRISTAWLSAGDAGGYLWTIDGTNRIIKNIIGWREIHE